MSVPREATQKLNNSRVSTKTLAESVSNLDSVVKMLAEGQASIMAMLQNMNAQPATVTAKKTGTIEPAKHSITALDVEHNTLTVVFDLPDKANAKKCPAAAGKGRVVAASVNVGGRDGQVRYNTGLYLDASGKPVAYDDKNAVMVVYGRVELLTDSYTGERL